MSTVFVDLNTHKYEAKPRKSKFDLLNFWRQRFSRSFVLFPPPLQLRWAGARKVQRWIWLKILRSAEIPHPRSNVHHNGSGRQICFRFVICNFEIIWNLDIGI